MPGCTHRPCDDGSVSPDSGPRARAAAIAAELATTGLALPGTLIERHVRCGKPRCACHADPPVLHGPYWQWTRKVKGKTLTTRGLSADQIAVLRDWLLNAHQLDQILAELDQLSIQITDRILSTLSRPRT